MTPSLRTALLSSLGALALASCGGTADPAKEQDAIAKVAPPAGKSWSQVVSVDGDGVVMGNPEARIKLEEFGVAPERLTTVRSAVDPGPFTGIDRLAARRQLAREWNIPEDRKIIGNLAYITEQKDHATLIRALAALNPALVRSRIRARSSSAAAPST